MPVNEINGTIVKVVVGVGAALGIVYAAAQIDFAGQEVTPEEADAGCVNQQYACNCLTSPDSGFYPGPGRPPYASLILDGLKCVDLDGGIYRALPQLLDETVVDPGFCVELGPPGDAGVLTPRNVPEGEVTSGCACRVGDDCFVAQFDETFDSGVFLAPWGETLGYQRFSGTDCFPKVCGEIAGISSWPAECPTLSDGGFVDAGL